MPGQIYNVKWNGITKKAYVYDGLGRITSETVYPVNSSTKVLENAYTYKNLTGNNTTALVSGLDNAAGTTFYTYDANGNITQTMHCDSNFATLYYEAVYSYDKFNQLTACSDEQTGKSYTFAYDDNGNITTYRVNGINKSFGYTDSVWGDLLTSYNGNTITYDEIGNPLTYKNGETFTWQNGRQLNFIFNNNNDITAVYSYDADGKRISKYTDAGDTFFTYAGDILAGQKTGDNVLVWVYDDNGKYIGFTYNGTEYYYVYNLQGDVVAIADSTGTIIARYAYGPWGTVDAVTDDAGNDISADATHIANINPIRYRGYYYDTETGFYYLRSRYYDPEICRFINADGYLNADYLLGYNAFSYCYNNPVLYVDHTGCAPSSNEMLKMVLGILPNPNGYTSEDVLRQQQAESRSNNVTNIAFGIEYDLGGGWKARIDRENTSTKVQRHVHVEKGKQKYSQNYDGSPHDGSNGSPPNSVLKKLKDKLGWDWKEKEKNYNNRKDKIATKNYEYSYNYGYNFDPPPITGDTTTPVIIEWIIKLFSGE